MFVQEGQLIEANHYHTLTTGETASLVTGSSPMQFGAKLLGFTVQNASATPGWAQVFDGYAAPSSGAVPIQNLQLIANGESSFDCGVFNCISVKNGIVIVFSSTLNTYTAITSSLITSCWWIP